MVSFVVDFQFIQRSHIYCRRCRVWAARLMEAVWWRSRVKWRKAPELLAKRGIIRRTGWGDHGAAYTVTKK